MPRVKLLLVALVLANAAAFAWWRGWLGEWSAPRGADSPLARQVAPERVVPVPLSKLDAAQDGACHLFADLDAAALERLAAWARERGTTVAGEPLPPAGLRLRVAQGVSEADARAALAEAAGIAGREPVTCPK